MPCGIESGKDVFGARTDQILEFRGPGGCKESIFWNILNLLDFIEAMAPY